MADTDFWIDERKGESPLRVWDQLKLGGITWPGLCKIGCGVGLDIEVAKIQIGAAKGTEPGDFRISLTDKGYAPGTVNAVVAIWTSDQWEDLKETLPKFSPRSGNKQGSSFGDTIDETGFVVSQKAQKTRDTKGQIVKGRDAFDIVHPATRLLAIDSVIIQKIDVIPIEEQTLVIQLQMLQYFPRTGRRVTHSSSTTATEQDIDVPSPVGNVKTR